MLIPVLNHSCGTLFLVGVRGLRGTCTHVNAPSFFGLKISFTNWRVHRKSPDYFVNGSLKCSLIYNIYNNMHKCYLIAINNFEGHFCIISFVLLRYKHFCLSLSQSQQWEDIFNERCY